MNEFDVPFDAVVLDANVLYPAALRDTLLRLAERDLYRPRWSALILAEVIRNLVKDRRSTEDGAYRLIALMRREFPGAEVLIPSQLVAQLTNAIEDRHVLAAAVEARAGTIVTSNLKHFPMPALLPYGIEAVSPDTFLERLYLAAPALVVEVLRTQAADLVNPPMNLREVLDMVALHAPQFVSRVLGDVT